MWSVRMQTKRIHARVPGLPVLLIHRDTVVKLSRSYSSRDTEMLLRESTARNGDISSPSALTLAVAGFTAESCDPAIWPEPKSGTWR